MPLTSRDLPVPSRALAIGAHPDDVEFGCGATLAKWSAAGCEVSHLICTDGSKGTWDPEADLAGLVRARRDEQRAAAATLGCTGSVVFLDRVDGELAADDLTTAEVAGHIRALRPDVILAHDPWRRYRLHPDHHAAGRLAIEGLVAARDPHFFPDRGRHHRPSTVLLFEADEPNHAERVVGHGRAKVDALLAHESQLVSTMFIPEGDDGTARSAFERRVLDDLARVGRAIGSPAAEQYRVLRDV